MANAVEKLMSEARHVVESASSSSGGGDTAMANRYVQKLRTALMQEAPHERRRWCQFELKALVLEAGKDGKPSLVDLCRVLTLPVAHASGSWLPKDTIVANIVDKLLGEVLDTSAAASAPSSGFGVASNLFYFFPKATARVLWREGLSSKTAINLCPQRLPSKGCHQGAPNRKLS